jgi:hypothetical protein
MAEHPDVHGLSPSGLSARGMRVVPSGRVDDAAGDWHITSTVAASAMSARSGEVGQMCG